MTPHLRRRSTLAVILLLHGAILVYWTAAKQPRRAKGGSTVYLSLVDAARSPARAAAPAPRSTAPVTRPAKRRAAVAALQATPQQQPAAESTGEVPAEVQAEAAAPLDGASIVALAKRQAGAIDRELRQGKSGVPDDPDTPMSRFVRGVESAAIERSMAEQRAHYVSPDGTRYTMITFQGRTRCYMSGAVNDPRGISGGPAEIACPNAKKGAHSQSRDGFLLRLPK